MPFSVKIYRFISILIVPFINFFLFFRVLRNKEDKSRKKERLGISKIQNNNNEIIWFHAASVGETLSILPIVNVLSENGSNILITTVTQTSSSIISKRFPKNVVHQYVPFDSPLYIKRFLSNWNPKIAIFIENKFPSAKEMAKLSYDKYKKNDIEDVAYFEPYYLKDFLVTPSKKKV